MVHHRGIWTCDICVSKILVLVVLITAVGISLMRSLWTCPGLKVKQTLELSKEDRCVYLTAQSRIVQEFHCFPSLVFLVLRSLSVPGRLKEIYLDAAQYALLFLRQHASSWIIILVLRDTELSELKKLRLFNTGCPLCKPQ